MKQFKKFSQLERSQVSGRWADSARERERDGKYVETERMILEKRIERKLIVKFSKKIDIRCSLMTKVSRI